MGRLWLKHTIETFKEIVDLSQESAHNLSNYFKIKTEDWVLSRTYRVFSNHQPIIMITEKFPESYFFKDFYSSSHTGEVQSFLVLRQKATPPTQG